MKFFAPALIASAVVLAGCQTSGSGNPPGTLLATPLAAKFYAGEDKDWSVAAQDTIRKSSYHAPTPKVLPGAIVITTPDLAQALQGARTPVLVNVLTGSWVNAVPGSVWMSGAGQGSDFDDETQTRLATRLEEVTGGDRTKPVVFYCLSSECWLSYNAALRAHSLGYTNVGWYRGGMDAWKAAGLPVERIDRDRW